MMKMLVEGIMSAELPWSLILIGVCVAIVMEILKVPVMPFAVGMYLPFSLNAGIMAGGLVRLFMDKRNVSEKREKGKRGSRNPLHIRSDRRRRIDGCHPRNLCRCKIR